MVKDLVNLFLLFSKVGLFSIGGGYVMLPMLRREIVEKRAWLSDEELLNCFSIAQTTPGIIATNTATYVGFRRAGIRGALAATTGMILPSFVIIIAIALFFAQMQNNAYVQKAFSGIRIAVAALLVVTVINLAKKTIRSRSLAVLALLVFLLVAVMGLSPFSVILAAALLSLVYAFFARRLRAGKSGL